MPDNMPRFFLRSARSRLTDLRVRPFVRPDPTDGRVTLLTLPPGLASRATHDEQIVLGRAKPERLLGSAPWTAAHPATPRSIASSTPATWPSVFAPTVRKGP